MRIETIEYVHEVLSRAMKEMARDTNVEVLSITARVPAPFGAVDVKVTSDGDVTVQEQRKPGTGQR